MLALARPWSQISPAPISDDLGSATLRRAETAFAARLLGRFVGIAARKELMRSRQAMSLISGHSRIPDGAPGRDFTAEISQRGAQIRLNSICLFGYVAFLH